MWYKTIKLEGIVCLSKNRIVFYPLIFALLLKFTLNYITFTKLHNNNISLFTSLINTIIAIV